MLQLASTRPAWSVGEAHANHPCCRRISASAPIPRTQITQRSHSHLGSKCHIISHALQRWRGSKLCEQAFSHACQPGRQVPYHSHTVCGMETKSAAYDYGGWIHPSEISELAEKDLTYGEVGFLTKSPNQVLEMGTEGGLKMRQYLEKETLARPFLVTVAPSIGLHIAFLREKKLDNARPEQEHLQRLIDIYGIKHHPGEVPAEERRDFCARLGPCTMRYQQYSEFSTYTFYNFKISPAEYSSPFTQSIFSLLPEDWIASIPGQVFLSLQFAVTPAKVPIEDWLQGTVTKPVRDNIRRLFFGRTAGQLDEGLSWSWGSEGSVRAQMLQLNGGQVTEDGLGSADKAFCSLRFFSDYRIKKNGCTWLLVQYCEEEEFSPRASRSIQRFLDMEQYRLLVLLALRVAQMANRQLYCFMERLTSLVARVQTERNETKLLNDLITMARDCEEMTSPLFQRFLACEAYGSIVHQRLDRLRMRSIDGLSSLPAFVTKRLDPALHTCNSVDRRLHQLIITVYRTTDLLRTRVDVKLQNQNRFLVIIGTVLSLSTVFITILQVIIMAKGM
eukprot:jgi/Mesvir1/25002/Mv16958-RA.2